ncbi:acetyl-CoA synthetase-like protein, partial [Cadophora sp. DSE1049]
PNPAPSPYLSWTFTHLSQASHTLALSLFNSGIRPRSTIISLLPNSAAFHVLSYAALELNCTFAPLNPKIASSGHGQEARHLFGMLRPAVVVVVDVGVARGLEGVLGEKEGKDEMGGDEGDLLDGWTNLETFVQTNSQHGQPSFDPQTITRKDSDVLLVFTTSGTTSLPKGCPWTAKTYRSILYCINELLDLENTNVPPRSACFHSPAHHIMGFVFGGPYHLPGLNVVHPSSTFTPSSTLAAIQHERVSDLAAVPALLHALVEHPDLAKTDTKCLKWMLLGATTILPETLKMAYEKLGVERPAEGYGMTETGPANTPRFRDIPLSPPERSIAGPAVPGAKSRVCDPETREVLPRGKAGELHCGGDMIISEYWTAGGKVNKDAFYTDEHGTWIMTGDQAVMEENGDVRIVGRYKDLIIRGGENISPSSIEDIFLSRFDMTAEVVGVPDEIAGEIPIAIIKKKPGQELNVSALRAVLVKDLGPAWVPEEILTLDDLGLEDYPRTSSGKVQKVKLREILREKRTQTIGSVEGESMLDILSRVWHKLLSLPAGTLTPQTSVHDWADSLILARFSAALLRESGLLISLSELTEHASIEQQARLLSSRGTTQASFVDIVPKRDGPPTINDIAHVHGNEERYQRTIQLCNETLAPLGLDWNDVQDVIPMNGTQETFVKYRRPQTSNHRHAWLCPGTSIQELEKAIIGAITHHPMLRSMAMYFDDITPVHATIRPSSTWWSHCLTAVPPIAKASDLPTLVYNDPKLDFACFPGPMFRFVLTYVEEENCAGMVYQGQHSVFDGVSLPIFLEDLDKLLVSPTTILKPHVPYKAWADSMYLLQDSALARQSVSWQARRLHGISQHPEALFPKQIAPEWFKGNSEGWIDITTGKPGPPRKYLDADPVGVKGILAFGQLHDIQALKVKHGIEGSQIVKAALAVVTTRYTGAEFAMFGQSQAGRSWPFLLDWQVERMPPAMDVDGPAVQGTLVRIPVHKDETVLEMMRQLQVEQKFLNKHAYAPMRQLVAAMNDAIPREGDFFSDASRRQIFNWLPVAPSWNMEKLVNMQVESRTDCGVLWNCIMMDQTTLKMNPTWDDAQLRRVDIEKMMAEILRVAEAFAREENWRETISQV